MGQQTFTTVEQSTWDVPAGETSITVELVAAGSASGAGGAVSAGGNGGGSGYYKFTIAVTALETLTFSIGGGGGRGDWVTGDISGDAGGSGGPTWLKRSATILGIAGSGGAGGGGDNSTGAAAGGAGGPGGGTTGAAGVASGAAGPGLGGTPTAGGAAGSGSSQTAGEAGDAVTTGVGGRGGTDDPSSGVGGGGAAGAGGGAEGGNGGTVGYGGGGPGGSGLHGGGGAGDSEGSADGGAGGGGASSGSAASPTDVTNTQGSGTLSGALGTPNYITGKGVGGAGGAVDTDGEAGTDGYMIITWGSGPAITGVTKSGIDAPEIIRPDSTGCVMAGTGFGTEGTQTLEIADTADYSARAWEEEATINTWADTSINFDVVYTETQVDYVWAHIVDGGVSSASIRITVSEQNIEIAAGSFLSPASTGNAVVVSAATLGFKARHVKVWTVRSTSLSTAQSHFAKCCGVISLEDDDSIVSLQENTRIYSTGTVLRSQDETNCLKIGDDATDDVVATGTILANGDVQMNFTTAGTQVYVMYLIYGGRTFRGHAGRYKDASTGVTGLAWQPTLNYVHCVGLGESQASSANSIHSIGFHSKATGSNETAVAFCNEQQVDRTMRSDYLGGQLWSSGYTWVMNTPLMQSDGFTYTSSGNADGYMVSCLNFDGLEVKIGLVTLGTGTSQATIACGFDVGTVIMVTSSTLETASNAAPISSLSIGVATADYEGHVVVSMEDTTPTYKAQMREDAIVSITEDDVAPHRRGTVTDSAFAQNPTLDFSDLNDSPTTAIKVLMVAIEATAEPVAATAATAMVAGMHW